MQYDYVLNSDLYGNYFIEFSLKNNIHGFNYYGKTFLNDLLLALNEIKPSLKNDDNYWNFNVNPNDEIAEERIKEKFEEVFNPDSYFFEQESSVKLIIETIYGEILFEENTNGNYTLNCKDNLEIINKINDLLKNNIEFNNKS